MSLPTAAFLLGLMIVLFLSGVGCGYMKGYHDGRAKMSREILWKDPP